jgi:hypothetical protein
LKITNKHGLPDVIHRAILNDQYNRGDCDFTATELLKPARIWALERQHEAELEEDVSDRLWSLLGQLGHALLERAGGEDEITEVRYFGSFGDYTVSAQVDSLVLEQGVLTDWKFTTSWGFVSSREPKPEWVAQLNIQAELLRQNGLKANKLQIGGFLRDWQLRDAKKRADYPQRPIMIIDLPLWSRDEIHEFVENKIKAFKNAQKVLPFCKPDEHWQRRRCESYCKVNKFCSDYQDTSIPI